MKCLVVVYAERQNMGIVSSMFGRKKRNSVNILDFNNKKMSRRTFFFRGMEISSDVDVEFV
jgi:hypothetical protein